MRLASLTIHKPQWSQVRMVVLYILANVAANLSLIIWGPSIAIFNAFVFVGCDLSARDYLHEAWGEGKQLWARMLALIGTSALISAVLNYQAGLIALASFLAFTAAGISDVLVYSMLGHRVRFLRINGSNLATATVDSIIFLSLATWWVFGGPLPWALIAGQILAKVGGGLLWSLVLTAVFDNNPVMLHQRQRLRQVASQAAAPDGRKLIRIATAALRRSWTDLVREWGEVGTYAALHSPLWGWRLYAALTPAEVIETTIVRTNNRRGNYDRRGLTTD